MPAPCDFRHSACLYPPLAAAGFGPQTPFFASRGQFGLFQRRASSSAVYCLHCFFHSGMKNATNAPNVIAHEIG